MLLLKSYGRQRDSNKIMLFRLRIGFVLFFITVHAFAQPQKKIAENKNYILSLNYDDEGNILQETKLSVTPFGQQANKTLAIDSVICSLASFNELDYLYGLGKGWMLENYIDPTYNGQGIITPLSISNNRVIKTISVNKNGQEKITFSTPDGKKLATCLSGQINGSNVNKRKLAYTQQSKSPSKTKSVFVDVHLPAGCESSLTILNNLDKEKTNPVTFKIQNLKTGTYVKFGTSKVFTGTQPNLPPGCYRIIWVRGGVNLNKPNVPHFSFLITQEVNYYNFSISYFDKQGRLRLNVPPTGVDSTYIPVINQVPNHKKISSAYYNSVNQTISTITPNQGFVEFMNRSDGQTRFSQNEKQRASNANTMLQKFSYANYDNRGKFIETGEYDPSLSSSTPAISFSETNVNKVLDVERCSDIHSITNDSNSENDPQFFNIANKWNEK